MPARPKREPLRLKTKKTFIFKPFLGQSALYRVMHASTIAKPHSQGILILK
jgi:hypothetical protein